MTIDGIYNALSVLSDKALDVTLESVGLEETCPYVADMGGALRQRCDILGESLLYIF